ncbi:hypothetical protein [Microseira wollei]|uniref:hypothetical protein n=1 Tax=Microseira wollei TaxID=467598 RepID=UPI001CFC60F3|nr:hypothetical protein [Microseira wollei]
MRFADAIASLHAPTTCDWKAIALLPITYSSTASHALSLAFWGSVKPASLLFMLNRKLYNKKSRIFRSCNHSDSSTTITVFYFVSTANDDV